MKISFSNLYMRKSIQSEYEKTQSDNKKSKVTQQLTKKLNKLFLSSCQSSYTIEASLALTLVIFACIILITPMLILNHQRNASVIMEDNARMVAQEKYAEYYKSKDGTIKLDQDVLNSVETTLSALSLASQIEEPGMKHIDLLSDSEITDKTVKYVANYEAVLPFSVFNINSIPQQVVASRRAWIGARGNRWMEDNGNDKTKDDITVYVSIKDSDVYHTTLSCTYITHDIHTTSGSQISSMRTKFGGRFAPCASCKPNTRLTTVYYTSGARSYHSTPTCKTMSSFIQPMKKSEAVSAGKHACVRCG